MHVFSLIGLVSLEPKQMHSENDSFSRFTEMVPPIVHLRTFLRSMSSSLVYNLVIIPSSSLGYLEPQLSISRLQTPLSESVVPQRSLATTPGNSQHKFSTGMQCHFLELKDLQSLKEDILHFLNYFHFKFLFTVYVGRLLSPRKKERNQEKRSQSPACLGNLQTIHYLSQWGSQFQV